MECSNGIHCKNPKNKLTKEDFYDYEKRCKYCRKNGISKLIVNYKECSNGKNCIHLNQGKLTKKDYWGESRQCNKCQGKKNKINSKKYRESKEGKKKRTEYNNSDQYWNANYKRKKLKIGSKDFTKEDYRKILKNQNGICAICEEKEDINLAVDHCHKTNQIRGLLCSECNRGLGKLGDTIEGLQKAINYLKNYDKRSIYSCT